MIVGGSYRLVRKIGQGGMGVVYEAANLRLPELRVAIKVMDPSFAAQSEFYQRFRREAAIGVTMRHPNIASVIDWNTLPDGSPFLVLEYLEGESLHERMKRGRLAGDLLQSVLRQVAAGLDAAHAKGVIHRDLKPRNIFLLPGHSALPEGIFVKVIDFGVSKIVGVDTLESTSSRALGTPRYMSPEQIRGDGEIVGPQSDQFALAAIAYELIASRPAFDGDNVETVLYRIAHEDPAPLGDTAPAISLHLERAIMRALNKAPAERFGSATQFVEAAFAGEAGRGDATIRTPDERTVRTLGGRRRKQQRVLLVTVALMALVVVAAVIVSLVGRPATTRPPPDPPEQSEVSPSLPLPPPAPPGESGGTVVVAIPKGQDTPTPSTAPVKTLPSAPHSAAAHDKLAEAETLAANGSYRESVRIARQSIAFEDSGQARLIVLLGYCHLADLGNARAALFSVRTEDRVEARRKCRAFGLDL